jgi:hypothetical protein
MHSHLVVAGRLAERSVETGQATVLALAERQV